MRLQKSGLALVLSCLPLVFWSTYVSGSTDQVLIEKYSDPTLVNFVRTAVESNPRVQAARAALDSSRAMESAAGSPLYNPELEAGYESSVDQTWQVGIGQKIDWNGKRAAREAVAASDRQSVENQYLLTRRELAIELLSALASYQISIQHNELATERQRLMGEFSGLAEKRFNAGDLNQIEVNLAALSHVDSQIQRATAAADLAEARQHVRSIVPIAISDQWPSVDLKLPPIPAVSDPQALVLQLPEIRAAKRKVDAAGALVELREREKRPDPTIVVRAGQEADSTLIGVNLLIPLNIRNPFKYEVSAAVAEQDRAQQQVNELLLQANSRFQSATERYELSRRAWEIWLQTGKISLQSQDDLLQRMWEAGELSTTEFLVQLRQTLDTRESALVLKSTMWRAWFEWLAASGQVDKWLGQEQTL